MHGLHKTWRCAVVSDTNTFRSRSSLRFGLHRFDLLVQQISLTGLRSGESGGQVNTLNSLCSSIHSWTIFAVWPGALSFWKRPQPWGNTVSMMGVLGLQQYLSGVMRQSNVPCRLAFFPLCIRVPYFPKVSNAKAPSHPHEENDLLPTVRRNSLFSGRFGIGDLCPLHPKKQNFISRQPYHSLSRHYLHLKILFMKTTNRIGKKAQLCRVQHPPDIWPRMHILRYQN